MKYIRTKKQLFELLLKFAARLSNMPGRKWEDVANITIEEWESSNAGSSGND